MWYLQIKSVAKNHCGICCDKCHQWVHIACNKIKYCYQKLQKDKSPWYCWQSMEKMLPFSSLTDMQLNKLMKQKHLISHLISGQDQIQFSDKNFSSATNDYSMPEESNKFIDDQYLHLNISLLFYHYSMIWLDFYIKS